MPTPNTKNYGEQGGARWVVSSGGEIDVLSGGALKFAGTKIDATAAELNANAGVTAGTVAASKTIVVDANLAYMGARRKAATKTANYTVLVGDSAGLIVANAVDLIFTLPAVANGLYFHFVVQAPSATTGLIVRPQAADKVGGNGFTSLAGKGAVNSAATDREGDSIIVIGDATFGGWWILSVSGTWAREA